MCVSACVCAVVQTYTHALTHTYTYTHTTYSGINVTQLDGDARGPRLQLSHSLIPGCRCCHCCWGWGLLITQAYGEGGSALWITLCKLRRTQDRRLWQAHPIEGEGAQAPALPHKAEAHLLAVCQAG